MYTGEGEGLLWIRHQQLHINQTKENFKLFLWLGLHGEQPSHGVGKNKGCLNSQMLENIMAAKCGWYFYAFKRV